MSHQFFTEDNVALELTFVKLFKKLWPFLWRHKKRVIAACVLVGVYVVLGRSLPLLFGYAIDEGVRKGIKEVVVRIAFLYMGLEVLRSIFSFWQSNHMQRLGNQVLFEIREKLISHVQSLPLTYFEKNPSGRTVTRVTNDVLALGELFSQGFARIFVSFLEMASIFIALAMISPVMAGITVLVLPPLIWICLDISKRIRVQFGAAKRKLSMINAFSAESMSGVKILQLFGKAPESRAYFNTLSAEYRDLQMSTVKLFATLWPVLEGFNLLSLAIALFVGAYFHEKFNLSLGALTAYIVLLQGFFKPLRNILESYNQLQNSLASADRVFHLLDEVPENNAGVGFKEGRLKGRLQIKNLSFRYGAHLPWVLKDVNLIAEPGASVALVGRTGSGKTTLISLLQKMYSLETGEILFDGVSLNTVATSALRPRVGVVQQDGFVFSGTVLSNITFGDPRITRERALWAAEQAHCQDILAKHGGLDGVIQERGGNLSAGERQLLAFARVLAFDPDILILDEATANIDSLSERHIQAATAIATKGRTSVIIAHRLSTILHADLIVVLDHGKVVEMGRHQELLAKRGFYFDLYSRQFIKSEAEPILEVRP